jgi:hypothetical protein
MNQPCFVKGKDSGSDKRDKNDMECLNVRVLHSLLDHFSVTDYAYKTSAAL